MNKTQIELINLQKYYKVGKERLHVLKNINLNIKSGEFLMIMGKSGSGKTTLLNILGFLDKLDEGSFTFEGENVSHLSESKRSELRANKIGYVFQQFNLIDTLKVWQNVEVPLLYSGRHTNSGQRKKLIEARLKEVGLEDKINSFPNHLSGGQKQRVAIARALVNNPSIIFADEPTGALDSETGKDIMNLLTDLNRSGTTIIMVTHDYDMTKYASRVITLKDGVFYEGGL